MKKRKISFDNIAEEVRTGRCCSVRCIQLILTVSDIYKTRECFFEKSREAQGQFLLNFFQVARRSKGQKTVYVHTIEKKYVCQKAWIFSHGMAMEGKPLLTILCPESQLCLCIFKFRRTIKKITLQELCGTTVPLVINKTYRCCVKL